MGHTIIPINRWKPSQASFHKQNRLLHYLTRKGLFVGVRRVCRGKNSRRRNCYLEEKNEFKKKKKFECLGAPKFEAVIINLVRSQGMSSSELFLPCRWICRWAATTTYELIKNDNRWSWADRNESRINARFLESRAQWGNSCGCSWRERRRVMMRRWLIVE